MVTWLSKSQKITFQASQVTALMWMCDGERGSGPERGWWPMLFWNDESKIYRFTLCDWLTKKSAIMDQDWDLSLKTGIWASRLKFGPCSWDKVLGAGISASRLGFEPRVLDLGFKTGIWASSLTQATEGILEGWRAELRLGEQIWGKEGKFEYYRADLMLGGLVESLEGRFEVLRSDLRWGEADWRPGGLNWGLGWENLRPRWPTGWGGGGRMGG